MGNNREEKMSHRDRRRVVIQRMKNTIVQCSKDGLLLDEEKLIARICIDTGIARRTAREYVNLLVVSGEILRENKKLFTKELEGGENGRTSQCDKPEEQRSTDQ